MAKELNLEPHREKWAKIAKERGWFTEPFFVQVFVDPNTNEIYDSVSFTGIPADLVVYEEQGEW
jgi:hypothetical protein